MDVRIPEAIRGVHFYESLHVRIRRGALLLNVNSQQAPLLCFLGTIGLIKWFAQAI